MRLSLAPGNKLEYVLQLARCTTQLLLSLLMGQTRSCAPVCKPPCHLVKQTSVTCFAFEAYVDSCLCLQLHYELDEDGDVPPGGGDALAKRPSVPTYLAVRPWLMVTSAVLVCSCTERGSPCAYVFLQSKPREMQSHAFYTTHSLATCYSYKVSTQRGACLLNSSHVHCLSPRTRMWPLFRSSGKIRLRVPCHISMPYS